MRMILKLVVCTLLTIATARCALKNPKSKVDPYEKMNRFFSAFNTDLDHLAIRPVTMVYSTITPPPLQKGVTNAFDNLQELITLPNDILQFKFKYALIDTLRFAINSTIGIGGLFDVASRLHMPKHYEDFGMTLDHWEGHRYQSPYLVIPFLGPSTFRAGFGEIPDLAARPWAYIKPHWIGWAILGLKTVEIRTRYLPGDDLVNNAFDPYIFVRSAYLQNRQRLLDKNAHDFRLSSKEEDYTQVPYCDSEGETCEIPANERLEKRTSKHKT